MLSLIFLSLNAFAVTHLPCQRALAGSHFVAPDGRTIELEADQVVLKGPLEAFWPEATDDQIAWSAIDAHIYQSLSRDPYDALFSLIEGDEVFILGPNGRVRAHGYHTEVRFNGSRPNQPRLLRERQSGDWVLNPAEYAAHFHDGTTAVVITRVSGPRMEYLSEKLGPALAAWQTHSQDPSRLIPVGSERVHERAVFEKAFIARVRIAADGRYTFFTGNGPLKVEFNDLIYLIDREGDQLGVLRVHTYPDHVLTPDERLLFAQARTAVIIRR
jgi:hypothetical protein